MLEHDADAKVAAYLGAIGIAAEPRDRDSNGRPRVWALANGVLLLDTRLTFNGHRLYEVRGRCGDAISKEVDLATAIEIAATFALPPGARGAAKT